MDFCLVLFQVKFELKLSQKNQTLMIKMWSVRGSAEIGSLSVDVKHAASCVYVPVEGRPCWSESTMHSNTKAPSHHDK